MFETIGTLFTIAIWVIAILLFLTGGGLSISNLIHGTVIDKIRAVISLGLAIFVFYRIYVWCGSVAWCMLLTGMEMYVVGYAGSSGDDAPPEPTPQPGPIESAADGLVDAYIAQQIVKKGVEDAIRDSK